MKRLIKYIAVVVSLCTLACSLFGCGEREAVVISGDYVVITVEADGVTDGATLKEYMDVLVSNGKLTYEIENGMVTSIGGTKASGHRYWMLYTDDIDFAVSAWGTCTYAEKTYGSASVGCETLPVTIGCTYIWYLQDFA